MLSASEPTNAGPIPKFAKVLFQMPECQDLGELRVLHTCVGDALLDILHVLICFDSGIIQRLSSELLQCELADQ